jgi:hypothetical protein
MLSGLTNTHDALLLGHGSAVLLGNRRDEMQATYTIPAKSSNSGSIHDLASDRGDRVIRFCKGGQYAVVLASYYGGRGYTTHKTARAAMKASRALGAYSHRIIDRTGHEYAHFCGDLVAA